MKPSTYLAAIVAAVISLQFIVPQSKYVDPTITKRWETDTLLRTPESVLLDEGRNILYVSNINGQPLEKDGNGFISKVSLEGKIENLKWVEGFDAPKGMGIYKNMLYVTDISKLVVIDIEKGQIVKTIEVEGAKFLNDITIDKNGVVYISDSETKKIHTFQNDKVSVWLDDTSLKSPNGLYASPEKLFLVDMESGIFYFTNYKQPKLVKTAEGATGGDGIVKVGNNDFVISNWYGELNYVGPNGKVIKLLDTKEQKINAADIEFSAKKNLIFVPTFFKNSVVAYELKK